MKTPEEIKRGLEHCASYNPCIQCDYDARDWPRCVTRLHGDAIAYIQQLEQDNAQKDERIRKLEREKGAMLRDMKAWPACDACKHRKLLCARNPCSECREAGNGKTVMWEWRGVEEDNHATD